MSRTDTLPVLLLSRHAANREGMASVVWEGGSMMSSKGGHSKGGPPPPLQQKKPNDAVGLADRPPKPRGLSSDAGVSKVGKARREKDG